ncbi:hypothetical protein [uncultured Bacteroides sp.]|uniref:hypothetical protein n=1 Tax=uncultured Bacteroides sp. TaxID=162156 RepID=UPI00262D71A8|nr:hypothetical protein [uncultured Bacteroides sp.]
MTGSCQLCDGSCPNQVRGSDKTGRCGSDIHKCHPIGISHEEAIRIEADGKGKKRFTEIG